METYDKDSASDKDAAHRDTPYSSGENIRETVLELHGMGIQVPMIAALIPCSEKLIRDILRAENLD